ncbi:uncharacterized protein [Arachis hypogaea]|uniref:uncharacterized protein n=1 Tax=Arachis hypogaea TaxID=3818 RepID=UPI000DEC513D|nr:uncharacterized protein LOC112754230 [Arachis hypogaea]
MKKERAPCPGVVRPRFKPRFKSNKRPCNKSKLDAVIQRLKLLKNIKARFKYNLDIYSSLLNKVVKYMTGRKSITQLSSDAAILMRGHPDLIDQFNKWIPRTRQDSCTLLSHHLAATHLENRDLQDEGDDEVSTDTDTDTDRDTEDWDWLKRSTKLGGCTDPYKVWKIWKKIKDRFKCDMEICESLRNKVDKYKDGRKSIIQLSSDVATLLRGHPDLIEEFRKWIPITPNEGSDEVSSDTSSFSSTDTDTDIYTDISSDAMD